MKIPFTCVIIIALLSACNRSGQNSAQSGKHFDCNSLADKGVVYPIAESIIGNGGNSEIWNLSSIDSDKFLTMEDYFTDKNSKNRIVLMGGDAGLSAGSAQNLLMLFSCKDSFTIIWSGQVGEIKFSEIQDLNQDGVKEIVG